MDNGSRGPLAGLRVIELGDLVSAPFCGKLLADLGADVVKIEPPGAGDSARQHGPFLHDVPHPERSGLFLYLNANKKGITLDITKETGQDILLRLLDTVDVLVENRLVHETKSPGLSRETVCERFPRVVVTSITPFGLTGPYSKFKGAHISAAALGGVTIGVGEPNREPITPPYYQGNYQAGILAAIATMTAVLHQRLTNKGQQIDISEAECWATIHMGLEVTGHLFNWRVRRRSGARGDDSPYPHALMPCKDGYISATAAEGRQWRRFLEVLGNPTWTQDPRFRDRLAISRLYVDEVDALLAPWFMAHTKQEIFNICRGAGVPFAPVNTVQDVLYDAHLREREFFVSVNHSAAGTFDYPGAPYRLTETPWSMRAPAPVLGEHNQEIFCGRLGLPPSDLADLGRTGVI